MSNKTKTNLFIDILLFVVFLIVYEQKGTGTTIHEWLGVVLGIFFIVHIVLHWKWIKVCSRQFMSRIKGSVRINYILDILIYFGFTTIIFSGLMISESFLPFFGFGEGRNHYWQEIHFVSVDITLFLVAIHFAMHWKWIAKNFKQYIINPLKNQANTEKWQKEVISKPRKSSTWSLSNFARSGFQILFILVLSGLISFGWYTLAGSGSTETYAQGFRQGNGRNYESRIHNENQRRYERYEGNRRGRHDGRGRRGEGRHLRDREHHQESGIFGIETLKNLMIFALITLALVTLTKVVKGSKRKELPQNLI